MKHFFSDNIPDSEKPFSCERKCTSSSSFMNCTRLTFLKRVRATTFFPHSTSSVALIVFREGFPLDFFILCAVCHCHHVLCAGCSFNRSVGCVVNFTRFFASDTLSRTHSFLVVVACVARENEEKSTYRGWPDATPCRLQSHWIFDPLYHPT